MEKLNTDLFGWNREPFCQYLDSNCPVLRFERLNQSFLNVVCPKTLALAQEIGNQRWRTDVWGMECGDGRFITVSTGSGRRGSRPFGWREILRTLAGKQGAVTTSDAPYYKQSNWISVPKHVRLLRIDVDDDRAWRNFDEQTILSEIRREQQICSSLGLPYSAFKTGRRGHQGIIPLPISMPFSLASMIMEMYIYLHERSGRSSPMVDKTNLTGQMRMPGGRHRATQDLALFIDIQSGKLFEIDTQAELMVKAFKYSPMKEAHHWNEFEFKTAAQELLDWTSTQRIPRNRRVLPAEMRKAVEELRDNGIVRRFFESCEELGVNKVTSCDNSESAPIKESFYHVSQGTPSRKWAQSVFDQGFEPGAFWEWINMGGRKAILAAHILYGSDGATKALETKARTTQARSENDFFDRLSTIRSCMSSFHYQCASKPVDVDSIRLKWKLAETEVKACQTGTSKPRWKLEPAIAVLSVLLADAQMHDRTFTELGLREIELRVASAFQELKCCTNMVRASLNRLSKLGLIRRRRSSNATSVPDVYQILRPKLQTKDEWIELY